MRVSIMMTKTIKVMIRKGLKMSKRHEDEWLPLPPLAHHLTLPDWWKHLFHLFRLNLFSIFLKLLKFGFGEVHKYKLWHPGPARIIFLPTFIFKKGDLQYETIAQYRESLAFSNYHNVDLLAKVWLDQFHISSLECQALDSCLLRPRGRGIGLSWPNTLRSAADIAQQLCQEGALTLASQ